MQEVSSTSKLTRSTTLLPCHSRSRMKSRQQDGRPDENPSNQSGIQHGKIRMRSPSSNAITPSGFNQTCQNFYSSLAVTGCTKRGRDIFNNCIVIELSAIQYVTCFIFETSREKCSEILTTQTPVFTPRRFKICLFKIAKMIF